MARRRSIRERSVCRVPDTVFRCAIHHRTNTRSCTDRSERVKSELGRSQGGRHKRTDQTVVWDRFQSLRGRFNFESDQFLELLVNDLTFVRERVVTDGEGKIEAPQKSAVELEAKAAKDLVVDASVSLANARIAVEKAKEKQRMAEQTLIYEKEMAQALDVTAPKTERVVAGPVALNRAVRMEGLGESVAMRDGGRGVTKNGRSNRLFGNHTFITTLSKTKTGGCRRGTTCESTDSSFPTSVYRDLVVSMGFQSE